MVYCPRHDVDCVCRATYKEIDCDPDFCLGWCGLFRPVNAETVNPDEDCV